MRRAIIVGCLLSGIGLLGLAVIVFGSGGVRDHIKSTYSYEGTQAIPNDNDRALVYSSSKSPSKTAADIIDANRPGDRLVTDAGIFLRYSDDIVSIQPDAGGSTILVEDEDSGYRHHFLYVGGWWGTYSGPAESFRGGGPGSGK